MALLEVRDLKVNFHTFRGVVHALDGVNLQVEEGEILGIVGETGCGKSVTGRAILGLIQAPQGQVAGGEILFRNRNLLKLSPREMAKLRGAGISMVFQDPLAALNPVFTIAQQIGTVLRRHGAVDRKREREEIRNVLEMVGLPPTDTILNAFPHELSGGMRQRVCIGLALACRPALMIADEPTTALDVTIQAQILRLLMTLRDRLRLAVILVTHDVGVAAQTCDRIAVMYAGSVVEQGPVATILKQPRHPYTQGLLKSLPAGRRIDQLGTIPGSVPSLITPPPGCRFEPRCPYAQESCRAAKPELDSVGDRHLAACFFPPGPEMKGGTSRG